MVDRDQLIEATMVLQFVAVGLVCLNHFPISLVKAYIEDIPRGLYSGPGFFGVVFLSTSAGYLAYLSLTSVRAGAQHARWMTAIHYVFYRYWRLALPIFAALAFDYFVLDFQTLSNMVDPSRASVQLITLSQAWLYQYLGSASVTLPMGASNMAWLGSVLFFSSLIAAMIYAMHPKMTRFFLVILLIGVMICAAVFYSWLVVREHSIQDWAAMRNGSNLNPAYGLWLWLYEYNPYVNLLFFAAGALVAAMRLGEMKLSWLGLACVLLSSVLAFKFNIFPPFYLALSLFILFNLDYVLKWRARAVFRGLARLAPSAYELFICHLLVFLPATLLVRAQADLFGTVMVLGRLLAATGFAVLVCYGVYAFVVKPLLNAMIDYLDLQVSRVHHI